MLRRGNSNSGEHTLKYRVYRCSGKRASFNLKIRQQGRERVDMGSTRTRRDGVSKTVVPKVLHFLRFVARRLHKSLPLHRWQVRNSQIAFLSQSLSLPTTKVRSAFHINASSLSRTLRYLLKDTPLGRYDKDIVANLKTSFKRVDETF